VFGRNFLKKFPRLPHLQTQTQPVAMAQLEKKRAIVVGGGISGLVAKDELEKKGYKTTILEGEARLGGKIHSLDDLDDAEIGAVLFFHNYPAVDTIIKKKLAIENVLPGDPKSVNRVLYGKENPSQLEKIYFATQFSYELVKYAIAVNTFDYQNDTRSFSQFLHDNNCLHLAKFFEFWVPGMGYGPLDVIPAHRALNYSVLYPFNIFVMTTQLFGDAIKHVRGGYQQVVEKMAEGCDVRTSVDIENIIRSNNHVSVSFSQPNVETQTLEAELLVLTMSPYHWPKLPMKLTPLEEECVKKIRCSPYPVAVCDIEGLPKNQVFAADALKKAGLGHVGLIHTNDNRDNPKGGRRCVVYVNLSEEDRSYSLDVGSPGRQTFLDDLKKLGYSNVTIRAVKIWEDYNPYLPKDVSELLERSQGTNSTYYVGSYSSRSYESVAGAEKYTREILSGKKESYFDHAKRAVNFWRMPSSDVRKNDETSDALKITRRSSL
jgi:hypothetical protein